MAIRVVLDAGHGLYTKGKQTPDGIKEWTINDAVCDLATEQFKKYGVEVLRTDHNEGIIDEGLAARVREYMAAGDVLCVVSVHHNALGDTWSGATGIEVYTDNNPTADDKKLADLICNKLAAKTGLKNRGVKKSNFTVINQNKITAVLVEGGFMDGTNDYKVITSAQGKQAYADAIVEAVVEMYNLKKIPEKPQWIQDNNGWWYRHADGSYTKNNWEKIGNEWYYFDDKGYALENKWQQIKNEWYYFDERCVALQNKWRKINNKWYYFNDDCKAVKGFQQINGKEYYFSEKIYKNIDICQLIMTDNDGAILPKV